MENRKVCIIGDGLVGSTTAYTMLLHQSVNEIVIIDINKNKTDGDVLDLSQGMSFVSPKKIISGTYEDCKDAHIIIITAGVAQKENETRIDLLKRNIKVFDSIINSLRPYIEDDTVILVVTNPVDILSYYTYKSLNIPKARVIGSGTVLDTSRLKQAISEDCNVDPRNIHTYVIGEHGDSEVAAFSVTSIGGISLHDYCRHCGKCNDFGKCRLRELHEKVKNSAYEIIEKKGATYYAVALAVNKIVETILNDQNSILTVSTYAKGLYDNQIDDVYLSLPCVVNNTGVKEILFPKYSKEEMESLIKSAKILKEEIRKLEI